MDTIKILWADDEIDLLKPHIIFLEGKGYQIETATNGEDSLDLIKANNYDLVFLDENMPGLSGLETLVKIKDLKPSIPVVMITKSEEDHIMEEAIGSRISDYLIKPVNPRQILTSIKKNIDSKRLVSEKLNQDYQIQFRQIGMRLNDRMDAQDWVELYKELMGWDINLQQSTDKQMQEILQAQKNEANHVFSNFIENNYQDWLHGDEDAPIMSHTVFKNWILPEIGKAKNTYLIVIDNLRYDQYKVLSNAMSEYFRVSTEKAYYSILPTATQYARNALFAGLLPSEILKKYPQYWTDEDEEGSKNKHEEFFLNEQLKRYGKHYKSAYFKVHQLDFAKKMLDQFNNHSHNDLITIVYNFVDMLSHAKSEMQVIKELADSEAAYRSVTLSWFEHSPLKEMMRKIAENKGRIILTTDHGTAMVKNPVKVIGDKNTTTNLRYKVGKNLNYDPKEVFEVPNPADLFLPKLNVSSRYIFAKNTDYFVYPNNYNQYVGHYKDTFQHGGVSLEEIIIPFVVLDPK